MSNFYIPIGEPEPPFTFGTCKYKVTKAVARKDEETGRKSILVHFNVTDINGVNSLASIFFDAKSVDVMNQFCEVNNMQDTLKLKKLTPSACEGRSGGLCEVKRANNEKYKNVASFFDGEMPPPTITKTDDKPPAEPYDDNIPF